MMSLDLTGINNINGFYTDHYLSTYFEENVNEVVKRWKETEEETGISAPWRRLRDAGRGYYRAAENERISVGGKLRQEAIATLANEYLYALGYGDAEAVDILCDEVEIPVYREYVNADGSPRLWVCLVQDSAEEQDVLSAPLIDESKINTLCGEDAVNALLFESQAPARFILLMGMDSWALIDRNKWAEKKCIIVSLEELFRRREETTFKAVATLFASSSLCPESGGSLLDELDKKSREYASGVSDSLKYALRESIELLGNEVIHDWVHNKHNSLEENPIDEQELTLECLRYMYRMLFLLFMEARPELGFAPMKSEVYLHAYSLESLREIAENVRDGIDTINDETHYIDQTLDKICSLVYDGYPQNEEEYKRLLQEESTHDTFLVPPLKAHIFDSERTPLIRDATLRDCIMLKIIDLMSVTKGDGRHRRERISYDTLGINQLGSVYEALLSYSGFIAKEDLYEVAKDASDVNELDVGYFVPMNALSQYDESERVYYTSGEHKGNLRCYKKGTFVYRLAGREREKSASYYTPECLTQCLVKYALQELLEGKTADEILQLTVCEPAMGSAAFLNEVINQLAEAYIAKREEETGENISHDQRTIELQRVKMFIADRNVYGIDLNPIAVELGEVSLWLNTISQDGHVPWFGNQLHNGNSLIGARRRAYTPSQLKTSATGLRWYDNEPEQVPYNVDHKMKRVYHFLVGDPGMSKYKDKVIKKLKPDEIRAINNWNREFTRAYDDAEIKQLQELSHTVNDLWAMQIKQQRDMAHRTQDKLVLWKYEDTAASKSLTIREKDKVYSQLYLSEHQKNAGPFARLKFAMDYWCALWFWPIDKAELLPSRDEFLLDMSLILKGTVADAIGVHDLAVPQTMIIWDDKSLNLPEQTQIEELQQAYGLINEVDLDKLCDKLERFALVREIASQQHFFHWELEFADLFEAHGGFDLIVGNPPWVKLGWKEQDVLADTQPEFAIKNLSAAQTALRREEALKNTVTKTMYFKEYEAIEGAKNFYGATQNYAVLRGQQTDLYKCFLPQGWTYTNSTGYSAFVHPESVYDDPKGMPLRQALYPRLRYHFQFQNELQLFKEVDHHKVYGINIYGNEFTERFDSIANLFYPNTISECYTSDGKGEVPGIKDENGWCLRGHSDRVLHVSKSELEVFASLFDTYDNYLYARLPVVHSVGELEILEKFAYSEKHYQDLGKQIFTTVLWDETNAQRDHIICRETCFPNSSLHTIYSGPHIGVANPFYKSSREVCRLNSDYDVIDLTEIQPNYRQRINYLPVPEDLKYRDLAPTTHWGSNYLDEYKIVSRMMLNQSGERTFVPAVLCPNEGHINGLFGMATDGSIAYIAGLDASIVYDYFVKTSGKNNGRFDLYSKLPYPDKYKNKIVVRSLLLNCLTKPYSDLWSREWDEAFLLDEWSNSDERISVNFSDLMKEWQFEHILRNDYERRWALVELDVLTAMSLNLTLDNLILMYRLKFPVLSSYENDTWYDKKGRIVFTTNKGLPNVGLSRAEFEPIKESNSGTFTKTFMDDTMPDGPVERTIEYVAPFDKCDRIEDYRTAWAFFEKKYGKQGGDA